MKETLILWAALLALSFAGTAQAEEVPPGQVTDQENTHG